MEKEEIVLYEVVNEVKKSDDTMQALKTGLVSNVVKSVPTATSTGKRQRSLMDMFPKSTTPKKQRLSEPSSSQESTLSSSSTSSFKPINVTFGKTPLNSIPFSLTTFKEGLSDEERDLLTLECDTIGLSWLKLLTDEIRKPYFMQLKRYLKSQGFHGAQQRSTTVFPQASDVYAWSKSPLGRVRVVIVGQDPYHNVGQAHGLCFSVPKGIMVPPSLKNIYSELQHEYPDFKIPSHGNLTSWAHNGVLLLNTCLTVKAHQANSHANKGWEQFTEKVIELVCAYGGANLNRSGVSKGVVFLAWGAPAAKRVAKVDKKKHLILTSPHPSPLSASRGFLKNEHFRKANEWLEEKYGSEAKIDWCRLDAN